MRRLFEGAIFAAAVVLLLAGCSTAPSAIAPDTLIAVTPSPDIAASSAMPSGPLEPAPSGYTAFCDRNPLDCTAADNRDVVALDPAIWQELARVNTQWNAAIVPEEDAYHYGRVDFWTVPKDGYGDCEDYALAKRRALIALGMPPLALRIALARTPQGEPHAVLTIATDHGDYVLDNRSGSVLPWQEAGLVWIARQAPGSNQWQALPQLRHLASVR